MDTDKKYIEMCKKATQIQEQWEMLPGDFCYIPEFVKKYSEYTCTILTEYDFKDSGLSGTWLPRQDQLQEMFIGTYPSDLVMFNFFMKKNYITAKFIKVKIGMKKPTFPINIFHSMEQLWLAFVMSENLNMLWLENSWIPRETIEHINKAGISAAKAGRALRKNIQDHGKNLKK